jgi:uncharacterized membrane protein YgdD (TMEM256/DUF423 family)
MRTTVNLDDALLARTLMAFAALLLAVATALGAVASHALEGSLGPEALHSFETAVEYQFIHSLGLLAVAIYAERHAESKALRIAATLLLVGILLFCGGVYASSLDGPRLIARMAPTGGVSLIAGWLLVAFAVLRQVAVRNR